MIYISKVVEPSYEQWEAIIRGMRNPMNSWDKSDTHFIIDGDGNYADMTLGLSDHGLMIKLCLNGSPSHRKFMRMIPVYLDINAPLYWWKEFDTYKVGTVANSCSTMHKIAAKEFELSDFSREHLYSDDREILMTIIETLNKNRKSYLDGQRKEDWWQMIQFLPSSYNQKRTVFLNYEVLANIYHDRKDHKLDEWRKFCKWIESLSYSELITGKEIEYEN